MAADAAALRAGLKPGLGLADARALRPDLAAVEADPAADAALAVQVVDWCRRFTPLVAPDGPDGVLMDIGGAAPLFGGEGPLLDAVEAGLDRQGFTARAAIAATAEAAWALARFGAASAETRIASEPLDPGFERLMAGLPVAALRIPPDTVAGLARAGLGRVGDLLMRPRGPIAARFGTALIERLDGLMGRSLSPISPRFEAPRCVAERRFASSLAQAEAIEAALLPLCRHLCASLVRLGQGARRIEASFFRVDGAVKRIGLGTSRPVREPEALMALLREKLASLGEDGLDTGYGFEVIRLAVVEGERLDARQDGLDAGAGPKGHDAADLADRLGARLGSGRVVRLAEVETHVPEGAVAVVALTAGVALPSPLLGTSVALPSGEKIAKGRMRDLRAAPSPLVRHFQSRLVGMGPDSSQGEEGKELPFRPIRLFDRPEPIETVAAVPDGPPVRFKWRRVLHEIAAIEGPERIAPEWWRPEAPALTRDYFRAEDSDGRRFWLYREGLYDREDGIPRWFLHGLFG